MCHDKQVCSFTHIKTDEKALQFIQAEKMFYEVALIELTGLQGSTGKSAL